MSASAPQREETTTCSDWEVFGEAHVTFDDGEKISVSDCLIRSRTWISRPPEMELSRWIGDTRVQFSFVVDGSVDMSAYGTSELLAFKLESEGAKTVIEGKCYLFDTEWADGSARYTYETPPLGPIRRAVDEGAEDESH